MSHTPAKLSTSQQAFVAAFVGTAKRNAHLAARMAGLNLNVHQAQALLLHPHVRAEIERRTMVVKVVDGHVLDVTPGPLGEPTRKHHVPYAARAQVEAERAQERAQRIRQLREGGEPVAPPKPAMAPPSPAEDEPVGEPGVEPENAPEPATAPRRRGRPPGSKNRVRPAADATPPTPGDEPPVILTADGNIAGSLQEQATRLERAARQGRQPPARSTEELQASLVERFHETGKEGVAHVTPDGQLALVVPVMTRYDIKVFLSEMVKGYMRLPAGDGLEERVELINDPALRLQAAGVLGKAMGLFSEKVINDEYLREVGGDAAAGSVDELKARADQTRLMVQQLRESLEADAQRALPAPAPVVDVGGTGEGTV
jgi:hypothetical protein